MDYKTNYNERSWAIDLIAHIKAYVGTIDRPIKEAGGENSIVKDGSSLFPDVLLFGDSGSAKILQGWELKMPDTPINDSEFLENAIKKAVILGLNSIVLWNVKSAHLYILNKETDKFELSKVWDDLVDIKTREQVKENPERWKMVSNSIIDTVNDYLDDGSIEGRSFIEAYRSGGVTSIILQNTKLLTDAINEKVKTDKRFKAQVTLWLDENGQEYNKSKGQNKTDTLSRAVLSNWLGKFLFAHILSSTSSPARNLLKTINSSTTVDEALDIFKEISDKCNFWTIFSQSLAMDLVPSSIWGHFLELNKLLNDLKIGEIDQKQLSSILEDTVSISSRKLRGQYTTPRPLARLLVELSINNVKEDRVADFCSGSGTIIRAALEAKLKVCSPTEVSRDVYASDLDFHANQMTTFALAKPNGMDLPIKVFNADVFSLQPTSSVTFKDPKTGVEFKEELGVFDVILSNLPFISQDGRKNFEDSIEAISDSLPNKYDFISADDFKPFNKKSDIYAYIPFHVLPLLKEGGCLGIVISNSWLGTEWGIGFLCQIIGHYHLRTVVTSGVGRWFSNSEVVTNILILEKRAENDKSLDDINFVTLKRPLADLEDDDYLSTLSSLITVGTVDSSESLDVRTVSINDLFKFVKLGVGLSSQFIDCDWLTEVPLIKISSLINSSRGNRRGWDALFYPSSNEDIESEFLEPVLLNSKGIKTYLVSPEYERQAFCCSLSENELIAQGKMGAYSWIQKFKNASNNSGVPLVESLAIKKGLLWYDFGAKTKADLVVTMNPEKRFFVAKIQESSIVNQRLICLRVKEDQDTDLLHALLNTALAYFLIESSGFGRGLGALDLKAGSFKSMLMLDPAKLDNTKKEAIKEAFKPLLANSRIIHNIDEELEEEDRIAFDKVVLESFGIPHLQDRIYDGLLKLVSIRLEAKNVIDDNRIK